MTIRLMLIVLTCALSALGQLTTVAETAYKSPVGGVLMAGTADISAAPSCLMTRAGLGYGDMRQRLCIGVTGSPTATCSATTAAGAFSVALLRTDTGTAPTGCYYVVRWTPILGTPYTETWQVTGDGPLTVKDVRFELVSSALWSRIDWTGIQSGCKLKIQDGAATAYCDTPAATWGTVTGTWAGSTSTWQNI